VGSPEPRSGPPESPYETLWRFARERHAAWERRIGGLPPPWTLDPVLLRHRFTCVYRVLDRVSQRLVRSVIGADDLGRDETFFRVALFKAFNREETWDLLREELGDEPSLAGFSVGKYARILAAAPGPVFTGAFITPSGMQYGAKTMFENHLRRVDRMIADGLPGRLSRTESLQQAYLEIRRWPAMGPFLAFQLAVDLNYSRAVYDHPEDWAQPGPGAVSGMKKCGTTVAQVVADQASYGFKGLPGRSLTHVDAEHLLCEADKYLRVSRPELAGNGRVRMKRGIAGMGDRPLESLALPGKWVSAFKGKW